MKVLFLSKDFRDGEDVSEHVKHLAEYLVEKGHEATIISFEDGSYYSIHDDVDVIRVPVHFEGDNIYNWSMILNNELKKPATELGESEFDLIHVHDWTTVSGGVTLAKRFEKPLVLTIHSTENMRGFNEDFSEMISELEWQGAYEADKVITTGEDAKNSVLFDLDAPDEKVEVIDPYADEWQKNVLNQYKKLVKQEKKLEN